jgi:hypothetical protein
MDNTFFIIFNLPENRKTDNITQNDYSRLFGRFASFDSYAPATVASRAAAGGG